MRAKKKFEAYSKEKGRGKNKGKNKKEEHVATFDHRNYGAWYVKPAKWETRFHDLSDPKSVKVLKNRRIPENERQSINAQTVSFDLFSRAFDFDQSTLIWLLSFVVHIAAKTHFCTKF